MVKVISIILSLMLCLVSCSYTEEKSEEVIEFPEAPAITDIVTDDVEETEEDATSTFVPADTKGGLDGIKICIDPGHGTFSQGYSEPIAPNSDVTKPAFVSGTQGQYQSEAEFNLKLGLMLKPMLEAEGATVYMTRTDENATLSNIGRAEYANELNCDMVVRIHADGSENTSANGISVLVPSANEYFNDSDIISSSALCAQFVLENLINATGAANRGVIERTDMTGFNWTEVPVILIESGFMSNPTEDALLADTSYQKMLADGILSGLIEYYMTV